jgi:hypothetical protein
MERLVSGIEKRRVKVPAIAASDCERGITDTKTARHSSTFGTGYANNRRKPRHPARQKPSCGGTNMLWTIVVILLILWALGLFAFNIGNLIHVLLVIAIIVVLVRVIQGRRPI